METRLFRIKSLTEMRASTQGLHIRLRPYRATMELVPLQSSPDPFQKYMLGVIEKVKDMHQEAFGSPPRTIELGEFLQHRLKPWIQSREFTELRLARGSEIVYNSLGTPVHIAETEEVQVTKDFLAGMVIQEHPEDTWIDVP